MALILAPSCLTSTARPFFTNATKTLLFPFPGVTLSFYLSWLSSFLIILAVSRARACRSALVMIFSARILHQYGNILCMKECRHNQLGWQGSTTLFFFLRNCFRRHQSSARSGWWPPGGGFPATQVRQRLSLKTWVSLRPDAAILAVENNYEFFFFFLLQTCSRFYCLSTLLIFSACWPWLI